MPRFSNVGGIQGFGPVDPTDNYQPFDWVWQARVWAINNVVPARYGHRGDEKRDLGEQLPAEVHMTQGYYERWLTRLEQMLVEDGLLVRRGEFRRRHDAISARVNGRCLGSLTPGRLRVNAGGRRGAFRVADTRSALATNRSGRPGGRSG